MLEHDVVVIGAGLAGLRAAIEAQRAGANVALVTKVHPVRSHSAAAQGGINAALGLEDDPGVHAYETVKGSDFLGDQDAIEVLCFEGIKDIIELEHMGVIFDRDREGRIAMRGFGGTAKSRTCHVGDMTGQTILHVMYEQLMRAGVRAYEEWFVTSLIVEDGECRGCVALDILRGNLEIIKAGAVILCAGGMGRVYEPSTNGLICTGDGMALAYRAGAPLMDMEMVQYHPTTLKANGFLITEGARGEGAYLLNSKGERFMQNPRYNSTKLVELASRDVVSRAETIEIQEGRGIDGCVLIDCRHIKDKIMAKLPQIHELALDYAGVDITEEPLPIRPGMHYIMGGVKTDIDGRAWDTGGKWGGLKGLFAAGECACVSVHGGNRLGGNSLLDCVAFGRRSGHTAADHSRSLGKRSLSDAAIRRDEAAIKEVLARPSSGDRASTVRLDMGNTMHEHAAVFRNEEGLQTAEAKIADLKARYRKVPVENKGKVFNTDLLAHLELGFMLDCAEAVVISALARKESRGAHCRLDYPERNDAEWLKHTLVYSTPEGPRIDYLPVTMTRWQPEKRVY